MPAVAENQAVVQIRWAIWRGTETGNSSGLAIDNISVTGVGGTPGVVATGTVSGLFTAPGVPSEPATISVSGTLLNGNLTVTAPAGVEVSTSSVSGFGSSVSLTPSGGSVATTPVYVRLASASSPATISGNLTVASAGADSKLVAVSGTVNGPVAIPFGPQDFESNTLPFVTYSVAGSKNWTYTNNTWGGGSTAGPSNKAMYMNGFGSDVAANDWLILGPLDCSSANNPSISFNTLNYHTSTNTVVNELILKLSTNYSGSGSPANATWSTLTFAKPASELTKSPSGDVALTGAANRSNVYVAFHYLASNTITGTTADWEVDDVAVTNLTRPTLTLILPGSINEGVSNVVGSVLLSGTNLASSLSVTVTSSNTAELLVKAATNGVAGGSAVVTIPAGSNSATFYLDAVRDRAYDTNKPVAVTATPGDSNFDGDTGTVVVNNVDYNPDGFDGVNTYSANFASLATNAALPLGWTVESTGGSAYTNITSYWGNAGAGAGVVVTNGILGYQHTG
ncbi:hypothetical protein EBX31_12670, partial [bacterium]|nr:hypothetical protein [bacterium]